MRLTVTRLLLLALVAAISFGLLGLYAASTQAGTLVVKFTVNNGGDGGDDVPGDSVCDTATGPPITCTFRAAIEEANALNGHNVINFTATNTVAGSPYDDITERVTIDASGNADGFTIDADFNCNVLDLATGSSGSIVQGLTVFNDDCDGLRISAASQTIGGDRSVGAAPNGQGNTFHSNCDVGIRIVGPGVLTLTDAGSLGGHRIQGNNIGPVKDGLSPGGTASGFFCNQDEGIGIDGGSGAAGPIVIGNLPGSSSGGAGAAIGNFANLVSANDGNGFDYSGGSADVHIDGNWFGLNKLGAASDPMANTDDAMDFDGGSGDATVQNNVAAGGGVNPENNPGDDALDIDSGYAGTVTALGNCFGFDSDCSGVSGGFQGEGVDLDGNGHVIGSNAGGAGVAGVGPGSGGGNVIGNIFDDAIDIDGHGNDVNGNFIGFGMDGEEGAFIESDCVDVEGENNRVRHNLIGNCGDEAVDIQDDGGTDGGNQITDNDIGRGTNPATSDPVDNHCIEIESSDGGNQVLNNVMANCDLGDDFSPVPSAAIQIDDSSFNVVQGNDISSPPNADAIDIINGGFANLIASDTFRMVNQLAGDIPIDLDNDGVTVNDPGDVDLGTNFLHNFPVFSPTSTVPGCARGSAGPFDQVRIYTKSTSGNVTTYQLAGSGAANLAGDFEICLVAPFSETAQTVVGTATTTLASTTDPGCVANCTSEFSVTEQAVPAGATATPTATNTSPPPTVTNTPVPTTPPPPTATRTPTTPPTATRTATPSTPDNCGDVNDDGSVTAVDAQLILQLVAGLISSLEKEAAGDVNGDGDITAVDAQLILQRVAGLIDDLTC